jgi:hypothetical protein
MIPFELQMTHTLVLFGVGLVSFYETLVLDQ